MSARKTALVTGTSKGGIGDSLAQELHKRGFRVFATARNPAKVEHLKELGIEIVFLEVTDAESIKKAAAEVSALTDGKLDMLVNNAGVSYQSSLLDAELAAAKALFDVNIWAVLEMTQAFSPLLIASKGTIINIGSVVGKIPIPFQGVYNMSKAALQALSKQMRVELSPFDIKVIHVVTGGIETDFFSHAGDSHFPETSPYQPGREQLMKWVDGVAQLDLQRTSPEKYAKSVIDNALSSYSSSCQWTGYGAWETWFLSNFMWYNATDLMLRVMGVPDLKKAIFGNRKKE
ncbi:Fc.00g092080.m01.CDS01 [Cosmosporella sp. VM-42]